jgi:hypothetical protein
MGELTVDLMHLLFKHQVALIRTAELLRAGGRPDHGQADRLAAQIWSKRECLGVEHYDMARQA